MANNLRILTLRPSRSWVALFLILAALALAVGPVAAREPGVRGQPAGEVILPQADVAREVIELIPAATAISKQAQTVNVGVRNANPTPGQMTWAATVVEGAAFVTLRNANRTNFGGETNSFQADFKENHVGQRQARIRVISNQAQNSPQEVVITQAPSAADLAITKTGDPARVQVGNNVVYTIAVTNNDPGNRAVDVLVTDSLPAQLGFQATIAVEGFASCLNHPVGYQVCNLGEILPGETKKYKLIAQANLEATVINLATVSSATPDPNAGNNTAQEQTVLTRSADLELGKSAPVEVNAGEELVYAVTVINHGPADATGVELVDVLPDGVVFRSADGCVHDGSPRGGAVTCTIGNVPFATAVGRTITVLVPSDVVGLITNSATAATGDQPDADPANNTASADTTVKVSADLRVTKTDNRTTVVPGRRIRYR
ncbi:MAG: DUF11 domain-containing protein, partial [bacterium]|nr:DUF11 domain-containing protein [bacterium]